MQGSAASVVVKESLHRVGIVESNDYIGLPGIYISGVCAVIPAYNEERSIEEVIRETLRNVSRVVLIDDASNDDTCVVAVRAGAEVLRHPINLGQGAALQTGIRHALATGASYIVTLDADGQHEPGEIGAMLEAMLEARAEVALGSRFKGEAIGMLPMRRVVLKLAVVFTRWATGLDVSDSHNGFRIFTASAAKRLCLRQNRMAHASEILEKIARMNIPYVEVPVTVRYTEYSNSKGQSGWNSLNILIDIIFQWMRK